MGTTPFTFISEKTISKLYFQLTYHQKVELRKKLTQGIYWCQFKDRGMVLWNWRLLQSYLLNGIDSPAHRSLVDEYLATLPQAS